MDKFHMKIKLPKITVDDEFIKNLKVHWTDRYGLNDTEINDLIHKYLKK